MDIVFVVILRKVFVVFFILDMILYMVLKARVLMYEILSLYERMNIQEDAIIYTKEKLMIVLKYEFSKDLNLKNR